MDALRLPDRCPPGTVPRYLEDLSDPSPWGSRAVWRLLGQSIAPEALREVSLGPGDPVDEIDMCTGMRMARDRSAIALVMAWRIHVA